MPIAIFNHKGWHKRPPSSGSRSAPISSSTSQDSASKSDFQSKNEDEQHSNSSLQSNSAPPSQNNDTTQGQKIAYLTFDDGPSDMTPKILDILKSKNVKATFFIIGNRNHNEALKRIAQEGHIIGIHSWSHNYRIIYSSEAAFLDDFNRIKNHIYSVTGLQPNICRFPGGLNNTVCLKYGGHIMPKLYQDITAMGIKPFDWNVSAHDASKISPSKELILQNIITGCKYHPNAVILLHDTNATATTLAALPDIIDSLSSKGYIFNTLSFSSPSVLFKPV